MTLTLPSHVFVLHGSALISGYHQIKSTYHLIVTFCFQNGVHCKSCLQLLQCSCIGIPLKICHLCRVFKFAPTVSSSENHTAQKMWTTMVRSTFSACSEKLHTHCQLTICNSFPPLCTAREGSSPPLLPSNHM